MKKVVKRMVALFGALILTFGIIAPVTPVVASSKNGVMEIPVTFSNTTWETYDLDGSTTLTETLGWGTDSKISSNYTVGYDLYIPSSFLKDESVIRFGCSIKLYDSVTQKLKGRFSFPYGELHADKKITAFDESLQEHLPVDFATVRQKGDYYVVSYNYTCTECSQPEFVNQSGDVNVGLNFKVQGININVKDCAVYLDNVKISNADGKIIVNNNFTSDNTITGMNYVKFDNTLITAGTQFATIINDKVMTVKPSKATVKVGKKTKISVVASPRVIVSYSSSNKKVATVDSKGVVTGKKAGKATITIKANEKKVKVAITVKNK